MANVDLIKDAYRTYLGREASDDEANTWASGGFGGGGVQDWITQIQNSGEAQARQTSVVGQAPNVSRPADNPFFGTPESGYGPGGVENPAYKGTGSADWNRFNTEVGGAYQQYLGRGASQDELNNWWSGNYGYGGGLGNINSILGAIRGSGEAQARQQTTGGGGGVSAPPATNVAGPQGGNFQQWFQQLTQGKPASPQTLRELAPVLQQYGIKLGPNNARGFTDGIFLPDGTFVDVILSATENGGAGWGWLTGNGVGGGPAPGNQYSDPYTQFLEQLIKSRIGSLQGGYDDMARRQYEAALQQRAQSLATGNSQLNQLMEYLQSRFTDLKGPGYTGAENEVLRTAALDPVERDRSAARKRITERLAAMGHTPESGVFQQALAELDKEFDGMRAIQQTQLATNELGRRENRNQRAEAIASQIADIPELRAREQLDVFQALNNLSSLARNEEESRSREAISYGGVLAGLGPERLGVAMQAAGMGGNPSALGGVLSNLMGINQQFGMQNQQNNASLWSGLGSLAAIIARSGQSGLSGAGY